MAKKVKPKILPKRSKLKRITELSKNHFIKYRLRSGKLVKKPRKNQQVFVEVYSKRTKKMIGYRNIFTKLDKRKKTRQVLPERINPNRQKMIVGEIESQRYEFKPNPEAHYFKIKTSQRVFSQILTVAKPAILAIMKKAREDGFCVYDIKMSSPAGSPISRKDNVRKADAKYNTVGWRLAEMILETLRDANIRTSPKTMSHRPELPFPRVIHCEVRTLEVEDLF